MQIKPVDVARLSAAQVSTLLAMGETRVSAQATQANQPRPRLTDLDEDARKMLLADLQSPVLVADSGPLSFLRLTDLSAAEAEQLQGKSFLQALTSSRTSRDALQRLSAFGSLLAASQLPVSTKLAGEVIRAIARLALHTRFSFELEPHEAHTTAAIVNSLAGTRAAPKRLRDYAQRSSQKG